MKAFIGRKEELRILESAISNNGYHGVLVYGRRRQGKSFLIREALKTYKGKLIDYQCIDSVSTFNLRGLISSFQEEFPDVFLSNDASFSDFLKALFFVAKKEKVVLVIDEYQFLRNGTETDSILQRAIDQNRDEVNLTLILCGSYVGAMLEMVESQNPLFGRLQDKIFVKPFDYYDFSLLFGDDVSLEDKMNYYAVLGGTPYYREFIDEKESFEDNLKRIYLCENAPLGFEIANTITSEISKVNNAKYVLSLIASGIRTYSKIKINFQKSIPDSSLYYILTKLMEMGYVNKVNPIGRQDEKKAYYEISDNAFAFYFGVVYPRLIYKNIENTDSFFKRRIKDFLYQEYIPHKFEGIAKEFLIRKNKSEDFDDHFDEIGTYFYNDKKKKMNGQFDLVTKNRQGYVFYEVKDTNDPLGLGVIQEEERQLKEAGLSYSNLGFISKSGFKKEVKNLGYVFYDLEDMYFKK